jgi:hypothetical protein
MGHPLPSKAAPTKQMFEGAGTSRSACVGFDTTSTLCNHNCGTDYALRLAIGFRFENLVLKPTIPDRSRLKIQPTKFFRVLVIPRGQGPRDSSCGDLLTEFVIPTV